MKELGGDAILGKERREIERIRKEENIEEEREVPPIGSLSLE